MEREAEHIDREIQRLKSLIGDYRARLRDAEEALASLSVRASGFAVGDEVEALLDGEWRPAVIRGIQPMLWGGCWFVVSPRKNNGQWSKAERRVFENVRAVSRVEGTEK